MIIYGGGPFFRIHFYPVKRVKAVTDNKSNANLSYEWYLYKRDYLEFIDNIEVVGNGERIVLTLPEEPSVYRLYLYVIDAEGNVTTTSEAISVE